MAKGKNKPTENQSREMENLSGAWVDFSKNVNERMMKLAKEGAREYDELYRIWSEYAQKMTSRISSFSPDDESGLTEMKRLWTDYSGRLGNGIYALSGSGREPYREILRLWSEYSERMRDFLSDAFRGQMKEQRDLYSLWMDAFGMKDQGGSDDMNSRWFETWMRSWELMSPLQAGDPGDLMSRYKELNDLWTKTYSKALSDLMKGHPYAEFTGSLVERNSEWRTAFEKALNQYLGSMGMPTKESVDDIYQKLHEIDRKLSELGRKYESSKCRNSD